MTLDFSEDKFAQTPILPSIKGENSKCSDYDLSEIKIEKTFLNIFNEKVSEIAERNILRFLSPQSDLKPTHTTPASMSTTKVNVDLYDALTQGLSNFGKEAIGQTLYSPSLSLDEILVRQSAVSELASNYELRKAILNFGSQLHKIDIEPRSKLKHLHQKISNLIKYKEIIRSEVSDPLLICLCKKLDQFISQDVVKDFLAIDFTKNVVPNRFSDKPDSKIRINPICFGETCALTVTSWVIGSFFSAAIEIPLVNQAILLSVGCGGIVLTSIEAFYLHRYEGFVSKYVQELFSTEKYKEMLSAVRALEELCGLGSLASNEGAIMPTIIEDGQLISMTDMVDPLAVDEGKKTTPISIATQRGIPKLITGQNGACKSYTCSTLIRNFTTAMMGGPVFAKEAVLPRLKFWAMQSPKQLSEGSQGRLGSEANTSSYLLQQAQLSDGPALVVFDEVGQGTSRSGTEECTIRVLGEAAASNLFVLHPTHELPIARRLYEAGLVDSIQVINSGVKISHGFEPGVAPQSGAELIADKVGYSEKSARSRVQHANGDLDLFDKWNEIGKSFRNSKEL